MSLNKKISTEIISTARIVGEEKAIELIAKAGFDAWDFSMFSMVRYDWGTGEASKTDHPLSGDNYIEFARKLKKISHGHQIVCITHLPQIAAAGAYNYRIYKDSDDTSTYTHVESLSEEQKTLEIARLLGGDNITDTTVKSAEELIQSFL